MQQVSEVRASEEVGLVPLEELLSTDDLLLTGHTKLVLTQLVDTTSRGSCVRAAS